MRSAIIVFGLVSFLTLSGCSLGSRIAEKATERALERAAGPGVDLDIRDGSYSVKTKEGEVNIGTNKLPDGWPSDVPAYPGGSIQYSGSGLDGSTGMAIVTVTSDSVETAIDYYKKKLEGEGWTQEASAAYGGTAMVQYKKGSRAVTVVVTPGEGNQTTVTVSVTGKE